MTDRQLSCTRQIGDRARALMADLDEVIVPVIVSSVMEEVLRDEQFVQQFATEHVRRSIEAVVQAVLSADRSFIRHGNTRYLTQQGVALAMAKEDEIADPAMTDAEQRSRKTWLVDFMEFVGGRRAVVRLGEMTRTDLLEAATKRADRGRQELRLAALFEGLAKPLADGQSVRDHWTDEQISTLYERLDGSARPVSIRRAKASSSAA